MTTSSAFRFLRAAGLGLFLSSLGLNTAAGAVPEKTDVFVSGEGGYHTYRIPAIVRTEKGTLLAFCEGRKNSGSDTGDIDLLLKRSLDGGRTWSAASVVWDDGPNTCGNPCPVVDAKTGTVWLLSTHNLGGDKEHAIDSGTSAGGRTVWLFHSDDDGATWSAPREITPDVKDPSWRWYATGPGVGIQIEAGPHAGRLVIPCDHSVASAEGGESKNQIRGSHAIYSDDHGRTWQRGAAVQPLYNECQVVELFDGRGTLLLDMRSYARQGCRAQATSSDGGATWSAPRDVPALIEPVCQASILRGSGRTILFSNPAHASKRLNLTVRASTDNAETWPHALVLHPGPTAYSCLVALSESEAGCFYENGAKRPYERLTFARFDLSALTTDSRQ
ncbi:MAG TPA: sialidase family protein [Opitutaceae bacterium]